MGDEPKKESNLPFSAPVSRAPVKPYVSSTQSAGKKRKPISARKQIRLAKKNPKSALNVKRVVIGLLIFIATGVVLTSIISPHYLSKVFSGELVARTEVCEVTETNTSAFFDTTCGKFKWDAEKTPGTPEANLVTGGTYTFTSKGLRLTPVQFIPTIDSYVEGVVAE